MRLVTFRHSRLEVARIGVVAGGELIDLATARPVVMRASIASMRNLRATPAG